MEAFALLKYWKGGGGGGGGGGAVVAGELSSTTRSSSSTTTTILNEISNPEAETDDDDDGDCDDDGPFFDLEFRIPNEEIVGAEGEGVKSENAGKEVVDVVEEVVAVGDENDDVESSATTGGDGGGGERAELQFTLSSGSSSCDRTAHPNLSLCPSDDYLFKGRLLPIESSSEVMNSKSSSHLAVSLLKSATKLRVLMSGLKKSKSQQPSQKQMNQSAKDLQQQQQPQQKKQNQNDNSSNKFFTVKFKIEEVPIISLFTKENGSRASNASNSSRKQPTQQQKHSDEEESVPPSHSKDVMRKYSTKVKPLHIRVPKRHGGKLRFSGQLSLGFASRTEAPAKADGEAAAVKEETAAAAVGSGDGRIQKQGNLAVGFRVMCKHLGKSKSVSSVVHSMTMQSRRRDDSLLQQQDGIQSAILHCKRSFNGDREAESSVLSRSVSDPSHDKSTINASAISDGNDAVADFCIDNGLQGPERLERRN